MARISVDLGERTYAIEVGSGCIRSVGDQLSKLTKGRRAFVVTDESVSPFYQSPLLESLQDSGFEADSIVLPPGEQSKCLASASLLYDRLIERGADRRSVMISLGGGVMGDLAGFVAATFARGIPFAQVPTTLLAMVDASVGGKVAVDHPRAKNIIGAFHQPLAVFCDITALRTLPERQYRCGLAEVVKYGVIMDEPFLQYLERNVDAINRKDPSVIEEIVAHCCRLKAQVVEKDEFETTGLRAILNYGHTFAHAFETASDYETIQHGEAVAIGMIAAGDLAQRLGRVDSSFNARQVKLWKGLMLPTCLPIAVNPVELVEIMRRDKKTLAGRLRFVLPTRTGHVELVDGIDEALVVEVLSDLMTS